MKWAWTIARRRRIRLFHEMGMDDKAVRLIMGITQEAIRSPEYRIQQNGKK